MSCKMRFGASAVRLTLVVGLVALCSPLASLATPTSCPQFYVCIANDGGTLHGTNSGLALAGSTVIGINNTFGTNLGSLTLSTGALTSGNLEIGGTFAAGGSILITEGAGTLFSGTFSTPVDWTVLGLTEKTVKGKTIYGCISAGCTYTLLGTVSGTYGNVTVAGATVQQTVNTKTPFTGGNMTLADGTTKFVTPEPGTLGLMGTGLLGIGLVGMRKLRTKSGSSSQAGGF